MVASPCARALHKPLAGRAPGGQPVGNRDRDLGSTWFGQEECDRWVGRPVLGGQGIDRDKLAKVCGLAFPTIALLPSADKQLAAGFWFAKRYQTHLRDVAYPVLRGGQEAEAGPMPPLLPAGAARGLGKDHDVLGDGTKELQLNAQPAVHVARAQRLNRAWPKATGAGGQNSISRPMQARELLIPTKCCCPVSGPHWFRRRRLRTFAPAAIQACRCSPVRRAL